jgi:hypothetical protein
VTDREPPLLTTLLNRRTLLAGAGLIAGVGIVRTIVDGPLAPASATLGSWGGYSNGQIPLSALAPVVYPGVSPDSFPGSFSQVYLQPPAAGQLLAMLQDYHLQTGDYLEIDEGYRSVEGQTYWWNFWGQNPTYAAPPGTSNHGWGQAFDFNANTLTPARLGWARSHCGQYGYSPIASEDWHFNYSGSFVANSSEDDDMIHYLCTATSSNGMLGVGQRFVQGADGPLRCLSDGEWGVIQRNGLGASPASMTGDQLMTIIARVGLYEYVYSANAPGGVGRLTGRILYGTDAADKTYPKTTIGS